MIRPPRRFLYTLLRAAIRDELATAVLPQLSETPVAYWDRLGRARDAAMAVVMTADAQKVNSEVEALLP